MGLARIYKDWLITKVTIWLKNKPFHVKTPIDYLMLSFKTSGTLPERIRALEIFGMYGLYVTKHYSHLCESVELWELDPSFAEFARKFSDKNVHVITGDSVTAVREGTIKGRFNLLVIDNPLVSPYGDELYEHFNVLPEIFKLAEDQFLVIFNVVLTSPKALYSDYGFNSADQLKQRDSWERKRSEFYGVDRQDIKPQEYLELYTAKFTQWGFRVNYSTFLPRNERVGFLGFALRRSV